MVGQLYNNELTEHVTPEFLLLKSDGKLLALYFHNVARVILPSDSVLQRSRLIAGLQCRTSRVAAINKMLKVVGIGYHDPSAKDARHRISAFFNGHLR
jgi:hypothetical protein